MYYYYFLTWDGVDGLEIWVSYAGEFEFDFYIPLAKLNLCFP